MKKYLPKLNPIKLLNALGILFIIFGIAIVAPILYFHYTNSGTASANPSTGNQVFGSVNPNNDPNKVTGFPINISIPGSRPALDINDAVIPGYYDKQTGSWTLTTTGAQFAVVSTQPNNISGNTFIYGHYRPNVFAYLHLIKPGTIASVTTNNGYVFRYKFEDSYAVSPQDTVVLKASSGAPILTIQTCSGSFFQNRQMYIFSYVNYVKVNS